jgi:pantetheine-phosphate adenylyltransferase
MRIAIYAGSFDPVTNGHLDIVQRVAHLFDRLIVAVGVNPSKRNFLFEPDERVRLLEAACAPMANVTVDRFTGLLVEYALAQKACAVIKGLRAISDFEYEFQQAQMNRFLCTAVDTLFVMTSTEYSYLSSSVVKEIAGYGGSIKGLVPQAVEQAICNKLRARNV